MTPGSQGCPARTVYDHERGGLWTACQMGYEACARLLVQHGANKNKAENYGATPLYIACQNGHEACARLLVELGANINPPMNHGVTPQLAACDNGNEACARLLVEHGAEARHSDLTLAKRNGLNSVANSLAVEVEGQERAKMVQLAWDIEALLRDNQALLSNIASNVGCLVFRSLSVAKA